MQCLICGSSTTIVRSKPDKLQVVRRRKCNNPDCQKRATTVEIYQEVNPIDTRIKIGKLTVEDVAEIKSELLRGQFSYRQIAKIFGISAAQVHKIQSGKSWPMVRPSRLD